jgi:hypothetical protein
MIKVTLENYLKEYLYWQLLPCDINLDVLSETLADNLIRRGYCADSYTEYTQALMCPINKRREKYCGCTHCHSHEFCVMLRKEAYI